MSNPPIILRSQWGARWGFGWSVRPLPATTIWLHHPVTHNLPASATQTQEMADLRLIEDIGRQRFRSADFVNGQERWKLPEGSGISYSYVVYRSGRIYQGHRLDRFSSHTAGYNHNGIGIAVQGNTDQMDMSPEQVEAVARLLVRLKRDGVATQARLTGGHRDTGFATSCPGYHAYRRIAEINALAAQIEAGQDVPSIPAPPAPTPQPDPNIWRAQAALNWLLAPTIPLAEDGWVGTLTNGADNEWRALDPTTPPMTPTDVYADYLEATIMSITEALAELPRKILDAPFPASPLSRQEFGDGPHTVGSVLDRTWRRAQQTWRYAHGALQASRANAERMAGLEVAVRELAAHTPGVDADEVARQIAERVGQYELTMRRIDEATTEED